MVSRKTSELGTVDEVRTSRFSHYRGLSHGSVMSGTHGQHHHHHHHHHAGPVAPELPTTRRLLIFNGTSRPGGSPVEMDRARDHDIGPLVSLPERRSTTVVTPDARTTEGIKTILYALALVHPRLATIIHVIRDPSSSVKRTNLERVFYNAAVHLEGLDRALVDVVNLADRDRRGARPALDAACQACLTGVMAYQHLAATLLRHVDAVVTHLDARYVRTTMLLLFNSLIEVRNGAAHILLPPVDRRHPSTTSMSDPPPLPPPPPPPLPLPLHLPATVFTPTSSPPSLSRAASSASRSGSASRRRPDPVAYRGVGQAGQATTTTTLASGSHPTPIRAHASQSSRVGSWIGNNLASTPSSAESAYQPHYQQQQQQQQQQHHQQYRPPNPSHQHQASHEHLVAVPSSDGGLPRPNGIPSAVLAVDDAREERLFERIFLKLTQADDLVLRVLPSVRKQFVRCIDVCHRQETEPELRSIWTNLEAQCSLTIQMAERLRSKLGHIILKEPEMRNDRDFWHACNLFVKVRVHHRWTPPLSYGGCQLTTCIIIVGYG